MLDEPPFEPVTAVEVVGSEASPSTELLAVWLELALGVPTKCTLLDRALHAEGLHSVTLTRQSGDAVLKRLSPVHAALSQPGQPTHQIVLPRRTLSECLAEELRGLGEDVMYGRVLNNSRAAAARTTHTDA